MVTRCVNALHGSVELSMQFIALIDLGLPLQYSSRDTVAVYTNGAKVPDEYNEGGAEASVRGNTLGGTFTLSLRGHTTAAISYKAADTTMKARLQELPNVGSVKVVRTGPTP